jgi:hypothetical protein
MPWHSLYNRGRARKTSVSAAEQPRDCSLRRRGCLLRDSFCWPAGRQFTPGYPGDFSQPAVGTSAFRVAVLRGSPHQLTSSWNSQSMLWCGRRRLESPNPREFAWYQRIKVRWYQCEGIWIVALAAFWHGCCQRISRSGMRNPSWDGWAACRAARHSWRTGRISCLGEGQACPDFELPSFSPGWRVPTRLAACQGSPLDSRRFGPTGLALRETTLAWAVGRFSRSWQRARPWRAEACQLYAGWGGKILEEVYVSLERWLTLWLGGESSLCAWAVVAEKLPPEARDDRVWAGPLVGQPAPWSAHPRQMDWGWVLSWPELSRCGRLAPRGSSLGPAPPIRDKV